MKYSIIVRDDEYSEKIARQISHNIIHDKDLLNPDIVIAVGGDGTILRAVRTYFDKLDQIVFYGINTGHLGFYSNWNCDEVDDFINTLNFKSNDVEKFNLLEFNLNNGKTKYALNEITMRNNYCVEQFDVYIDGELFEIFRGTGLCLSTTNGSTALNKSLGGSIIDTDLEAIQLSEIASVNSNAYRTLGSSAVFSKNRKIEIKRDKPARVMITADQEVFDVDFVNLKIKISDKQVCFAKNRKRTFWNRVNQSFI